MELSKRLTAVADLVTADSKIADIGTDHAYIPIWLVQKGRIPFAIAMDVNVGPLERAQIHVKQNCLEEQIELRLSNGFESLKPGEVDAAVIAGMGGGLLIRILQEGMDIVCTLKECILQPQSEIEKVRAFLLEEGFFFLGEDMVEEDGKYYPMMKVRPPQGRCGARNEPDWNETELRYGKLLLRERNPVLREYLRREICIRTGILDRLKDRNSPDVQRRIAELEEELKIAEKGMDHYAV